jgi:probable addiction module antidote protein
LGNFNSFFNFLGGAMVGKSNKPEEIASRLNKALARGDSAAFIAALMEIVRARGLASMARQTGVSRHTLYRYEWGTDRPLFETALRMTEACGFKLVVVSVQDTPDVH